MREINDYYTIAIDQLYETQAQKSKIIKLNDAWVDPEEGNRFVHKRLYGTIVSGPMGFSDEVVNAIGPGYPEPKAYVSGDKIQLQRNLGDRTWGKQNYNPGTFEGYEIVTMADYAKGMDVGEGDKVYFTETVTEPENFLGFWGDKKALYRCRADNVICVVRSHDEVSHSEQGDETNIITDIIMQGTWVLVEPVYETWDEITTPSGIIMQPKPGIKYLLGTIKHINDEHNKVGDKIFYIPDSNWGVTVEDYEYFGIRKNEILVTVK